MGHKINSLILRSKIYPFYKNIWNIYKNNSIFLEFYVYIKYFIKKSNLIDIINVNMYYINNKYLVLDFVLVSKNIYHKKKYIINKLIINYLKKNFIKCNFQSINFSFLINPLISTTFLLNYIINKTYNLKISLRKIIPYLVMFLKYKYKIKGVKCIISGRINGIQMAKTETFKFGKNLNQTKSCLVKYNFTNFITKYGLIGIKLWLFLK